MKKILFLCGTPAHPIHKKFAESINADFFYFPDTEGIFDRFKALSKIPRNYDIYFSEGLFGYLYLAKKFGLISKSAKTINLFSDPRLIQLVNGERFDPSKEKVVRYGFFREKFQIRAIKSLDGGICVGSYEGSLLRKIDEHIKFEIVQPIIEREAFLKNKLSRLEKNTILFLGNGPDYNYKGIDFLLEVFGKVSSNLPNAHLKIIGGQWDSIEKKNVLKNVSFVGEKEVEEIIYLMEDASLYCHFGRGEAYGIAILEAMSKGLPTFVSEETGAKEAVNKVDEDFVVNLEDPNAVAEKIEKYLRLSPKKRREIGEKFGRLGTTFTEEKGVKIFKGKFESLVKTI